ncbi:MAG: polysaccharide biosynthesis tyrosine autokinase [Microscillaceae bacterium]|nr:polysaccharide biosynthesis tyrosine autokinase [Microscillaceae bacterium]
MARIIENDSINLGLLFFKIRRKWWWFFISIPLFAGLGYYYAKSLEKVYGFRSVLLLNSSRTGSARPDELLEVIEGVNRSVNTDDEIGVITSLDMIKKAVIRMNMGISYFASEEPRKKEQFPFSIFKVKIDSSQAQLIGTPIFVKIISEGEAQIWIETDDPVNIVNIVNGERQKELEGLQFRQKVKVNQVIKSPHFRFTILPSEEWKSQKGKTFHFIINSIDGITKSFKGRLEAESIARKSYLIELKTTGTNKTKEWMFLDTLMQVVVEQDLEQKNLQGRKALTFIEAQIREASDRLRNSENKKEAFQSSSALLDYGALSNRAITGQERLMTQKETAELKLRSFQDIYYYLGSIGSNAQSLVPSNANINDPTINRLFSDLIQLVQERAARETSETANSPRMLRLNNEINETRSALKEYLKQNIQVLQNELTSLNQRIYQNQGFQTRLPSDNRKFEELSRDFERDRLRLETLLNKRDEALIGLETNTPDVRIVEKAKLESESPIKPNTKFIFILALMIGVGLPFSALLLGDMLNTKVFSADDLRSLEGFPLLGLVGQAPKKQGLVALEAPRSITSESFRGIKLNLDNFFPNPDKPPVLGFTSSQEKEGKSFCALNLSLTYAQAGKKTLLIGGDLHKTQFEQVPGLPSSHVGLVDYLMDEAEWQDIIQKGPAPNHFIITTGKHFPENPTSLLESPRIASLFDLARMSFEVILVDIAPVGYVSDYFLFRKHIDFTVFVVRYGKTKRSLVKEMQKNLQAQSVQNAHFLLNAVDFKNDFEFAFKTQGKGYYQKS